MDLDSSRRNEYIETELTHPVHQSPDSSMKSPRLMVLALSMVFVCIIHGKSFGQQSKEAKESVDATPAGSMMKSLLARSIGPAIMGGRVSAIALDPADPFLFYIGLGTGGVMKTSNNGGTFAAIFERENVAAVGAISVSPSHRHHVWVGTGEANDRNSSGWGDGVYHSQDGGGSWRNVGLKESKTIARIAVHPRDTNTVWVAAMGDLWTPNRERGLYKTTDGGTSWSLVLGASGEFADRVGCGDVVLDTTNPSIVYATLYARLRTPWSFLSGPECTGGKDVGGIFKSADGGTTWKKLVNGLPPRTGRIGLDMFRKNPSVLYAVVQSDEGGTSSIDDVYSKRGGVFRSTDAGETWMRASKLNPRPFYFSQIRVDPLNAARVYLLGYMLHVSDDSGASFREDHFGSVHADCHDLVIDPGNTKRLILGTDGGPYQSFESGKGWQHLNTMAAGEFYRIAVDTSVPYRIAGGLQDNLSWVGPSMTRSTEGIRNSDWLNIMGGDGFYCVFDPSDRDVIYAESQEGYVHRYNMKTGEVKGLRPEPAEGQQRFRFHWSAPLIPCRHHKGAMYLGGNRVFKLFERGEQWNMISPDLSRHDPGRIMTTGSGAENYGVVYALVESPIKGGVLWAGTDDGKLWITTNDGATWTDLTENLPKDTRGLWISRIEAGHHDAEVAYIAIDGHRSGIYVPVVLYTANGGKSWKSVSGNLPAHGPVKVVREGLYNPNLLFAGTEFNLFVSLDRGTTWEKFGGLPTVAVDDIVIHPREMDLIIATHGRSLYIVDDIKSLEEDTPEIRAKEVHLFSIRPSEAYYQYPGWVDAAGVAVFRGVNPPQGAIINYSIREFTGEPVSIAITNASGIPVANLTGPGSPGINRVVWDCKPTRDLLTSYGGEGQKFVRRGEYTVTASYGKAKHTRKLQVNVDPEIETR